MPAFDHDRRAHRQRLTLADAAVRAVLHAHLHVVERLPTRAAFHFVAGQATAERAEHGHRGLAVTATDLVPDHAAQHPAGHRAQAGALALHPHRLDRLDRAARQAGHRLARAHSIGMARTRGRAACRVRGRRGHLGGGGGGAGSGCGGGTRWWRHAVLRHWRVGHAAGRGRRQRSGNRSARRRQCHRCGHARGRRVRLADQRAGQPRRDEGERADTHPHGTRQLTEARGAGRRGVVRAAHWSSFKVIMMTIERRLKRKR